MKTKINRLLSVLVVVMLLSSLTVGLAAPAAAADGAWSTLSTPVSGGAGNYIISGPVLGDNPGPSYLTKNSDGSILYVSLNVGEGDQGANLYKSTDGGRTWIRCSNSSDDLGDVPVIEIVTSPRDAQRVYVVTNESAGEGYTNEIYRSTDGGATFSRIVSPVDETGVPLPVRSLAVGFNGNTHFLYIATIIDQWTYMAMGDIWMVQDVFGDTFESTNFATNMPYRWVNKVFVSPNFATEAQPMVGAISSDGYGSYVTFSYGGGAWGSVENDDIILAEGYTIPYYAWGDYNIPLRASVGFPSDFDSRRTARDFFIGVAFADYWYPGGVYRIIAANVIDTEVVDNGIGVTSIAVTGPSGNCKVLVAGCNLSEDQPAHDIYHSEDNAQSWNASKKSPPQTCGYGLKYLVMDSTYNTSGKALVAVAHCPWEGDKYDESGVSGTLDFGVTWTDYSLLNTTISQIFNITPSPFYATDSTLFMAVGGDPVYGTADSIWKWDGKFWTRVMILPYEEFGETAETIIIQCSPTFSADKTVFVADTENNTIYRATDTGFWFKPQYTPTPEFDGAMLVLSSTKMLIGSGPYAVITANNGTSWDEVALLGASGTIQSFDVAADGKTLLAGTSDSKVYLSTDTGVSWKQVPAGKDVASGAGAINVAFDSGYATNFMIYASAATTDRVYQLNTNTGTAWSTIDGYVSKGGAINDNPRVPGIQMASDGTLYVANQTLSGTAASGSADSFMIFDPIGGDSGVFVVTSGAVTAVPKTGGTATVTSITTQAFSWTTPAAGDYITITATSAPAIGTWTRTTGTAAASIVSDADLDSAVTNPSTLQPTGTFLLADKAGSSTSGSNSLVMRSLTGPGFRNLFDSLTSGFTGTAGNTRGVWYNQASNGPQIWILESSTAAANNRIWTYTDRLTGKATLTSPANNSSVGRQGTATLTWTAMPTASNYQIQIGTSAATLGNILDASVGGTSYIISNLMDGTQYSWRVRSAHTGLTPPGKAASQWSDTWTFTMGLGPAQWDPFIPAERVNPIPASYNVPIRPTFMWNPADWATGYEFVLSTAADFSNPIYSFTGATALKITAFVADKDLAYGTDYYWKVTAISATSKSNTAYGSFRTMLAAAVPAPATTTVTTLTVPPPVNITIPPTPAPITPTWIWAIVIIGAVLVIAVIILIVTTRRVP